MLQKLNVDDKKKVGRKSKTHEEADIPGSGSFKQFFLELFFCRKKSSLCPPDGQTLLIVSNSSLEPGIFCAQKKLHFFFVDKKQKLFALFKDEEEFPEDEEDEKEEL